MSQGKTFGCSSSQAQQRVKHFKFFSKAKLFLKFSWQPASLVIHPFDVCFKNLAQTHTLRARNPNKQCEKPRNTHGKLSLNHHSGINGKWSLSVCLCHSDTVPEEWHRFLRLSENCDWLTVTSACNMMCTNKNIRYTTAVWFTASTHTQSCNMECDR